MPSTTLLPESLTAPSEGDLALQIEQNAALGTITPPDVSEGSPSTEVPLSRRSDGSFAVSRPGGVTKPALPAEITLDGSEKLTVCRGECLATVLREEGVAPAANGRYRTPGARKVLCGLLGREVSYRWRKATSRTWQCDLCGGRSIDGVWHPYPEATGWPPDKLGAANAAAGGRA